MKGRTVRVAGWARREARVGERSRRGRVRTGECFAAVVAGREEDISERGGGLERVQAVGY